MALLDQIENLRKEDAWSQADLAARVGGDAGQTFRYENGKITSSVEAVIRLAEIFDVSTDDLLLDDVPRRPCRAPKPTPCSTASPTRHPHRHRPSSPTPHPRQPHRQHPNPRRPPQRKLRLP